MSRSMIHDTTTSHTTISPLTCSMCVVAPWISELQKRQKKVDLYEAQEKYKVAAKFYEQPTSLAPLPPEEASKLQSAFDHVWNSVEYTDPEKSAARFAAAIEHVKNAVEYGDPEKTAASAVVAAVDNLKTEFEKQQDKCAPRPGETGEAWDKIHCIDQLAADAAAKQAGDAAQKLWNNLEFTNPASVIASVQSLIDNGIVNADATGPADASKRMSPVSEPKTDFEKLIAGETHLIVDGRPTPTAEYIEQLKEKSKAGLDWLYKTQPGEPEIGDNPAKSRGQVVAEKMVTADPSLINFWGDEKDAHLLCPHAVGFINIVRIIIADAIDAERAEATAFAHKQIEAAMVDENKACEQLIEHTPPMRVSEGLPPTYLKIDAANFKATILAAIRARRATPAQTPDPRSVPAPPDPST